MVRLLMPFYRCAFPLAKNAVAGHIAKTMSAATSENTSPVVPWHQALPLPFLLTLILGVFFAAFITWDQWNWWQNREDYSFGFLVPVFVGYVVFDRWAKITGFFRTPVPASGEKVKGPLSIGSVVLFTLVLIGGLVIFTTGAFYRAAAGPSYPGSLFIALGSGATVFALIYLNLPAYREAWNSDKLAQSSPFKLRWELTLLFLFPCFVWIISAPMVSFIENRLSMFLLNKVIHVVFFVFEVAGFALEKQGNVLLLPTGRVGVEDACSGIRSLTACLFAGSFLGATFLNTFTKKFLLIALAMFFAFLTNLLRSLFLTGWAYAYGSESIGGTVHDVTGYAVLGLTCIGLIALLPIMNLEFGTVKSDALPSEDKEKDS